MADATKQHVIPIEEDLETSELAHNLARAKFEKEGRRIVDATVDGALRTFPKLSLEEALRQ